MSNIPSPGAVSPGLLTTTAFGQAASQGVAVQASVDGQSFTVLAEGQFSGASGSRSVAWVQGETDTTSMFVRALQNSFGAGLSGAVARELGLDPAPGRPLASRLVQQALDMAETGQQALGGVDFLTRLDHSASAGGGAWRAALARAGVDPQSVTAEQKAAIDQAMEARFAAAQAEGKSPVASSQASAWLQETIARHLPVPR